MDIAIQQDDSDASGRVTNLRDDPDKDFRERYQLPEHFVWDQAELKAIDYEGYIRVVLGLLPPAPARVLDVGCGDGWFARELLRSGYSVTGIDYSERAIAFARLMAPEGDFHVGDIRLLGERQEWAGAFDALTFVEVLEHIPPEYHHSVLRGIHAALKPGGTLIMSVPSINIPMNAWHYRHFSVEDGAELLASVGLQVESVVNQHVIGPWSSPRVWRLLRNRIYDLRVVRTLMRRMILSRYNTTASAERAGRYVYRAIRG